MARCRFVAPETVRLNLSDGDWIDVKKELNAGDTQKIFTDLVKDMRAGEAASLDPEKVGKTKILTYVLGWSLIDAQGRPAPFTADALESLDIDTYKEIEAAVDAHETHVEEVRAARKNGQAGEMPSSLISPSAV